MNRTIKFRGKRIDTGEWVYGYYVVDPLQKHRIYFKPFDESTNNTYHFVIPETVGKFTGLLDREGKEIYEGDILCIAKKGLYEEGIGIIKWQDWLVEDNWMCKKAGWHIETKCPQIWTDKSIEIIGSIHENPELLNK
jgi:uncharacterized phage protein (TIGR01671 family)